MKSANKLPGETVPGSGRVSVCVGGCAGVESGRPGLLESATKSQKLEEKMEGGAEAESRGILETSKPAQG